MISSVISNSAATQYTSAASTRAARARSDAATGAPATRDTDVFYSRAATKSAATYSRSAAPKPPAVQSPGVATWEDRQETAKNYNAILEELRAQYDEPEAMRIFDQVLAADGFERVPEYRYGSESSFNDGYSVYHTPGDRVNGFSQPPFGLNSAGHDQLVSLNAANNGKYSLKGDANLILQSTLTGTSIGGEPQAAAESWALFSAQRPLSDELQSYWHDRYFADASAGTDIDLDAYMAKLQDPAQKSVVAVDAGVGALVSGILKENGIELGEGEYLDIGWSDEFDSITVKSSDTYRSTPELGKAFNASPELRAAVRRLEQNPPLENVSQLPGEYTDGERSVDYSVRRNITYSADEPSAVVVNDYLGVTGSGYTYVKKAGDYFDPNAENHIVQNQRPIPSRHITPDDEFFRNGAETDALIKRTLNDAIETGAPVGGTTSRQAILDEKARVSAERDAYYKNTAKYLLTPEGATPVEQREEAAYDKENPLPERIPESPKEEIRYTEERMADWRKIVEQIRVKFFAIDTLIRPAGMA